MGIKGSIPDEIDRLLGPEMDFVPAHPMAGREGKGYGQSTSRIFEGANFIVIKRKENRPGKCSLASCNRTSDWLRPGC